MPPARLIRALVFLFLLTATRAQNSPAVSGGPSYQDRLLVCNKADHSLSVFDPVTRKQLAVLPTGQGPHEVAISPDGRTAVVSDYGAQQPGSTLTVIDVLAAKVLRTIQLAELVAELVAEPVAGSTTGAPTGTGPEVKSRTYLRPHGSSFVDSTHLVVTSESTRRLLLVDLAQGRVERTWSTPQQTMHMVALSPDRKHAFATSIKEGNVAWFDLGGAAAPIIVPTGQGAEGLAVNPATGEAWVGNRAANTVSIVDPQTGKVTAELPTGDFPFRVAFAYGGGQALVTCAESGSVNVFDTKQKQPLQAIEISGDGSELSPLPMGIAVDPDSRFAYVACGRGEFVAVLDLQQKKVVDRIVSRAGPDGIGYARIVTKRE